MAACTAWAHALRVGLVRAYALVQQLAWPHAVEFSYSDNIHDRAHVHSFLEDKYHTHTHTHTCGVLALSLAFSLAFSLA